MVTNYSANDTLRGNKAWGLPICLALVSSIFLGAFWYCKNRSNHNPNFSHYNPSSEIRAVESKESQDFCSRNPNDLARLVDKYRGRR